MVQLIEAACMICLALAYLREFASPVVPCTLSAKRLDQAPLAMLNEGIGAISPRK